MGPSSEVLCFIRHLTADKSLLGSLFANIALSTEGCLLTADKHLLRSLLCLAVLPSKLKTVTSQAFSAAWSLSLIITHVLITCGPIFSVFLWPLCPSIPPLPFYPPFTSHFHSIQQLTDRQQWRGSQNADKASFYSFPSIKKSLSLSPISLSSPRHLIPYSSRMATSCSLSFSCLHLFD